MFIVQTSERIRGRTGFSILVALVFFGGGMLTMHIYRRPSVAEPLHGLRILGIQITERRHRKVPTGSRA